MTHFKYSFVILLMLTACTGAIEDTQTLIDSKKGSGDSGESAPAPTAPPTDTPTPPGVITAPDAGQLPDGSSGTGGGASVLAPEVTILNINNSYLRGGISQNIIYRVISSVGAVSRIEYVVNCPTSTSVPTNSILTGDAMNTSSAVTIQDNVVSAGTGSDTYVVWNTPNLSDVKCTKTDSSLEQALNNFKIRITSIGANNSSTSVESINFQIDSGPPNLSVGGLSCPLSSCLFGGLTQIQISNVTDLVTPVSNICLKTDDTIAPADNDLCWKPVNSMGANQLFPFSELTPGPFIFKYFMGFLPFQSDLYFWAKDAAGNISTLSNSELGTLNQDLYSITSLGTTKIASNDVTFAATAQGLYHEANITEQLTFLNGTLNEFGQPKDIKKFSESHANYSTYLADLSSVSMDPAGRIFIKDSGKGLVKINTEPFDSGLGTVKSVEIPKTGTFNEGPPPVSGGPASFKNLKRHAIDSKGFHWFIDDNKLSYINFSATSPILTHVAGGGADDTSDTFTNPKSLLIHSSDNIDAYGVFAVLPNQWVVFSADDPTLPLNPSSGNRFKLRIYKHSEIESERRVTTVYLSGITSQGSTDDYVPYGGLAVSYDSLRSNIKNITGRFCQVTPNGGGGLDSCASAKLIRFSISEVLDPVYMGTLAKDSLMNFQYLNDTLYMMDNTYGNIYYWNVNYFQKIAGTNARGSSYCINLGVSTSCNLRLVDFKPIPTNNDQYLIIDNNYLRILEQGQIFTIYSTP